jgi:hypothetical protein
MAREAPEPAIAPLTARIERRKERRRPCRPGRPARPCSCPRDVRHRRASTPGPGEPPSQQEDDGQASEGPGSCCWGSHQRRRRGQHGLPTTPALAMVA